VGASNATNSGRRRLLAASTTPQMLTVYYDLAGVPQGQASSAQNTLNSDTSALVAAANKQGAVPRGAGYADLPFPVGRQLRRLHIRASGCAFPACCGMLFRTVALILRHAQDAVQVLQRET